MTSATIVEVNINGTIHIVQVRAQCVIIAIIWVTSRRYTLPNRSNPRKINANQMEQMVNVTMRNTPNINTSLMGKASDENVKNKGYTV